MPISSNPNSPTFCFDELPLHWQMTRCEKYAFEKLLQIADAEVAIEIGTYKGGSLQLISQHAEHVYSLDISPTCREELASQFANVDFRTGDSKALIADVLDEIRQRGSRLGFVLIDGDHTTEGVRGDINAVLQHVPDRDMYVVFHDSFNPPAREGILSAAWQDCPYVHFVEVDYVPGVYHHQAFDTAPARSMYGGLAVALLKPEPRQDPLVIHQSQQGLFDVVFQSSCYADKKQPARRSFLQRLRRDRAHVRPAAA
ncbi:MAG: class I SAM-dependent methyltransferase, partial [Planctomycetaceae bacterium]|nr:class I SAM-dependent methyltransferase [Planctomycetaceae bacterium]